MLGGLPLALGGGVERIVGDALVWGCRCRFSGYCSFPASPFLSLLSPRNSYFPLRKVREKEYQQVQGLEVPWSMHWLSQLSFLAMTLRCLVRELIFGGLFFAFGDAQGWLSVTICSGFGVVNVGGAGDTEEMLV